MTGKTAKPCVVAFAGGGGGVGRSTLAMEVARALARTHPGRVLLVDAAARVPTLQLRLGVAAAARTARGPSLQERTVRAGDLEVLHLTADETDDPVATLEVLRARPMDLVVIDLPAPPDRAVVGFFTGADIPVAVTAAELHSLFSTLRLLQEATIHLLEGAGVEIPDAVRDPLAVLDDHGLLPIIREAGLEARWDEASHALSPWLLLNHARDAAERDLAPSLALSISRMVGPWPRVLGAVDHDERRWFHMRQQQHGAPLTSDEGHGVQIRELAKRIDDRPGTEASQLRVPRTQHRHAHETLGVPVTMPPLEVRATYRRLWEGLRRDSALTRGLLPPPLRDTLLAELEEANRKLQTWLAERREATTECEPAPVVAPRSHPGSRIAEERRRKGVSRRELSLRTKIGLRVLDDIEAFDVDSLPRAVYLRGYLREIALALALDAEALMGDYLDAVAAARRAPILTRRPGGGTPEEDA